MFVIDGIVYGGEPEESVKISQMKILPDKIMILTFSNGEERLFDATVLRGGVYERLKDESIFQGATIEYGVITWDNGNIDCAPEYMYKNSYEYASESVS